ncbi:MAG: hypothetical protein Q4E73_02135 [Lachnospiraceae bacterium]|nr:hypothetical protein [Lachnospiraceae bacterium]
MKTVKYESPKFDFQELKLMERVADQCWGFHYGWYDVDGDGQVDSGEIINLASMGSCNSVEEGLVKYINENFGQNITNNDVKTNSHSTIVKPRNS